MGEAREDAVIRALERSRRAVDRPTGRADRTAPAPLTSFQEGLWYNALIARESGRTSEPRPVAIRITGPLDHGILNHVLVTVQERHAVLRSRFPAIDGEPVQVVTEDVVAISVHDLTTFETADRLVEARRRAREVALTPFDLEREVPFRPHLFVLGEQDHLLLLGMHHLVFDGWSVGVLLWELGSWYAARLGIPCDAPDPVSPDFGDIVTWRTSRVDSAAIDDDVAYWRGRLEGIDGELDLPAESVPPVEAFPRPISFDVTGLAWKQFEELAKSLDTTPFAILLAAAQVFAARLSGQSDFAVSVATAGRDESESDRLIGCFINMMLLPAHFGEDTTFADAVSAAKSEILGGLAHQRAPFSRVVSGLRRPAGKAPSNVLVQMRRFPRLPALPDTGMNWEPFDLDLPAAAGLTIEGRVIDSGLQVFVSYDPTMFTRDTIARWTGEFQTMLEAGLRAPETNMWDLDLLASGEHDHVVRELNAPMSMPDNPSAPVQIASMAATIPDATAFESRERSMTYRDLQHAGYGVAHQLVDRGVTTGSRVVLFMDPGLDAALAVLGSLWSGSTYVPVDPSVSAAWLETIVKETQPALVVTHRRLIDAVADVGSTTVAFEDLMSVNDQPPPVEIGRDDVAYVCFTSGSTGAPKGVVITHGNLSAVLANQTYCRYGEGSRVLQMYSISFDGYVTGLLGPLVNGAACVLYERDALNASETFLDWCRDQRITHMGIPTSLFHTLIDDMDHTELRFPDALEHIAVGGEELRTDAVSTFHDVRHQGLRLHNTYGPTEATVWMMRKDLTLRPDPTMRRIPIGTPVPNASVYVLDRRGTPTPIGVAGELHIGGNQVGVGYLGRPELTHDRFVADPFSGVPGARMYRSGDLTRWNAFGEMEFLGRMDRQVKIRGYRVEPEAVERVLRRHPGVKDVAVIDMQASDRTVSLRAYLVVDGPVIPTSDLIAWCRASLPEFTIPSVFMILDELPRTVSRKLDRHRLPEPVREVTSTESWGPTERAIAAIWGDVLVTDVPAGADFFALGGHSLLAMRVIGRVKRDFSVELPLSSLFEHPSVEGFAEAVEQARARSRGNGFDALMSGIDALDRDALERLLASIEGQDP